MYLILKFKIFLENIKIFIKYSSNRQCLTIFNQISKFLYIKFNIITIRLYMFKFER